MCRSNDAIDKNEVITNTIAYVQNALEGEGTGHDWWHIDRVTKLTKKIAEKENANMFICIMAALLHDIADEKLNESEKIGIKKVRSWLASQSVDHEATEQIMDIITSISFKGGNGLQLNSVEAKVVQDADRLDAIGAIGIARCFVYSGATSSPIHDPFIKPREHMTKEEYRHNKSTAINHFYEKLLKLKDLMNTETSKQLAIERHRFMEMFLDEFYEEWEGRR
nr:HD domain-containing protein [Pseudogracilibacillus auburnensis]